MPRSQCPACGVNQETPAGVGGFRCQVCQTDVQRIRCSKCAATTILYGPVTGGGAMEFRCAHCNRRVVVSKQHLRAINAEVSRSAKAAAAIQRQATASAKEAKAEHARSRELQTQARNAELNVRMAELAGLLTNSLDVTERFSFGSLRLDPVTTSFEAGELGRATPRRALKKAPVKVPFDAGRAAARPEMPFFALSSHLLLRSAPFRPALQGFWPFLGADGAAGWDRGTGR
jgi:hypothetical protein